MEAPETARGLLRIKHSDFPAHIIGITGDNVFVLFEEAEYNEVKLATLTFDEIVSAHPELFHIHEDWCYFEFLSEGIPLWDFYRALRFDVAHDGSEHLLGRLKSLEPELSELAENFVEVHDDFIFTPAFVTWWGSQYWMLITELNNGRLYMGALDGSDLQGAFNVATYISEYDFSIQRQLIDLGNGHWMTTQWGDDYYPTHTFQKECDRIRAVTDWIKEVEATAVAAIFLEFDRSNGVFDADETAAIERAIDVIKTRHVTLNMSLTETHHISRGLYRHVQENLRQESRAYGQWYDFFTDPNFTERDTFLEKLAAVEDGETQWLETGDYLLDY